MMEAAILAGEITMKFFRTPLNVTRKSDGSPVTPADQKAEACIIEQLSATQIPILGEERAAAGEIPDLQDAYFCVDALDGTKEFIKGSDQFTVNIALIKEGVPVLGVIYVPARAELYAGGPKGAFQYQITNGKIESKRRISTRSIQTTEMGQQASTLVTSVSHKEKGVDKLASDLNIGNVQFVGSSLKLCLLARGDAQIYPRLAPTCYWDIAAGHGILLAAGGVVLNLNGEPMEYPGARPGFLNSKFVAAADQAMAMNALECMNRIPT